MRLAVVMATTERSQIRWFEREIRSLGPFDDVVDVEDATVVAETAGCAGVAVSGQDEESGGCPAWSAVGPAAIGRHGITTHDAVRAGLRRRAPREDQPSTVLAPE